MDIRTTFLPTVDSSKGLTKARATELGTSADGRQNALGTTLTRLSLLAVDAGQPSGNMPTEHGWPTVGAIARRETAAPHTTGGLPERPDAAVSVIEVADQRVDAMLATASHELASPLTALGGSLQLAERWLHRAHERAAPDQQQPLYAITQLLNLAGQQVERMNRLVGDLQDSAAMQAGKLRMRFAPANLVAAVTGVVAEQRLVHPRRVFSLELPECESLIVTVDADRIRQVLTNFLTNAVKYTPARKPIEIRLHVTDTMVRVSVRDQGPGLEPAQHEHVWKRFHQAHPLHEGGDVTGLGLGLYISRVIIEQHHGNVGLESVAGQGATFWFDIPLRLEEPRLKEYAQAQS